MFVKVFVWLVKLSHKLQLESCGNSVERDKKRVKLLLNIDCQEAERPLFQLCDYGVYIT